MTSDIPYADRSTQSGRAKVKALERRSDVGQSHELSEGEDKLRERIDRPAPPGRHQERRWLRLLMREVSFPPRLNAAGPARVINADARAINACQARDGPRSVTRRVAAAV